MLRGYALEIGNRISPTCPGVVELEASLLKFIKPNLLKRKKCEVASLSKKLLLV